MDASPAGEGKLALTLRLPIGIVGAISPFNFPLNLVAHKIAPALAAGCAVVLKPASATPFSALFLAEPRAGSGPPARLAERRLRLGVCDRRRARRGRAREADHVHRVERRRLGPGRARAPQARQARARATRRRRSSAPTRRRGRPAKLAANAFSFAGQSCISVQRIFVLDGAWDEFLAEFVPAVEALQGRRPVRRIHRRRPGDQRGGARPDPRLDR